VNHLIEDPGPCVPLPILVVTGMAREARLAAAPDVFTIHAGGAPYRLREALDRQGQVSCRAVVSFGIAGGLDPVLGPGDVIVAAGIVSHWVRWPVHPVLARHLASSLTNGGMKVKLADLGGTDVPLLHPTVKSALRTETGAAAVDMESHIAAAYAAERRLPFAAVRVICDPAGRTLPAWAAASLLPNGEVSGAAVLRGLLRQPHQISATVRLAIDAAAAFRALRRCRELLGVGFGVRDLGQSLPDLA
jgi:adenosylhomocysteine nucleosidase